MNDQLAFWGASSRQRRPGRPSRRDNLQRALDILAVYQDAHGGPGPSAAAIEPHMQYILMGDEDWRDPMLKSVGRAARALYWDCLSWASDQIRGRDIPSCPSVMGDLESWFIPIEVVRGERAVREAKELVAAGLWIDLQGGYRYLYLRDENKPKTFYEKRLKETRRKRGQRAPRTSDDQAAGF